MSVPPHTNIVEPAGSQVLVLVSATPLYHESRRVVVVARLRDGGSQTGTPATIRIPPLTPFPAGLAIGALGLLSASALWGLRMFSRRRAWWARLLAWLPVIVLTWASWQVLLRSFSPLL